MMQENIQKDDFMAHPQVVQARAKYRQDFEEYERPPLQNTMFDKRVVRGNTYARVLNQQSEEFQQQKQKAYQRAQYAKQSQLQKDQVIHQQIQIQEQLTVHGRIDVGVATDEFVTTQTDLPPNYEKDTQTDFKIDNVIQRLYMVEKFGVEKETQIWDGTLFDFAYEAEPIVQVLIGKTLDVSRMEVLEEEELRLMKNEQMRFQQLRDAEMSEQARLSRNEQRLLQENLQRKGEHQKKLQVKSEAHRLVMSRVLAKQFMHKMQANAMKVLDKQGFFVDQLQVDLRAQIMPWFLQGVVKNIKKKQAIVQFIQIQGNNSSQVLLDLHQNSLNQMFLKYEAKDLIRIEQEIKINQKRLKNLEKKRLETENERRQTLKNEIERKLVVKGGQKDIMSQPFADIDCYNRPDLQFIGLFGGIIGELAFIFSTFQQLINDPSFEPCKGIFSDAEVMEKLMRSSIEKLSSEGILDIAVNETTDLKLKKLHEELTLENLTQTEYEEWQNIMDIILPSIHSPFLDQILLVKDKFNISEDIITQIKTILVDIAIRNPTGKTIRFIKQAKVKLDKFNQVAVAQFYPPLSELIPKHPIEKIEAQPTTGNVLIEGGATEETAQQLVQNYAEAELEDKATLIPASLTEDPEYKVFVLHPVAQILIRNEIVSMLAVAQKKLVGIEDEIVKAICKLADDVQNYYFQKMDMDIPSINMSCY